VFTGADLALPCRRCASLSSLPYLSPSLPHLPPSLPHLPPSLPHLPPSLPHSLSRLFGCRAWCFAEKAKRRNLHKEDVQAAVAHTEIFDFLVEVINTPGSMPTAAPGAMAAPSAHAGISHAQMGHMGHRAIAGAAPTMPMQTSAAMAMPAHHHMHQALGGRPVYATGAATHDVSGMPVAQQAYAPQPGAPMQPMQYQQPQPGQPQYQ